MTKQKLKWLLGWMQPIEKVMLYAYINLPGGGESGEFSVTHGKCPKLNLNLLRRLHPRKEVALVLSPK